jgi:hypothetical protein
MLKLPITFNDFNGNPHKRTYEFNYTQFELAKKEMTADGLQGYQAFIERVSEAMDTNTLMKEFEDFVGNAVGRMSADGTSFDKSPQIRHDFEISAAYATLCMRMVTDADFAANFVNQTIGLTPQQIAQAKNLPQDRLPKNEAAPEVFPPQELVVEQPSQEDLDAWGVIQRSNAPTELGASQPTE